MFARPERGRRFPGASRAVWLRAMPVPPVFDIPERILMGPGPSQVPAAVLGAMARPSIGHLDPVFLALMDQVREMLREVFGTHNPCTLPMSGTGSAGMETCLVNLIEPGDRVLVGVNGVFGTRLAEVARRAGGEVTVVEGEWGRALDADALERAAGGRRYAAPLRSACRRSRW